MVLVTTGLLARLPIPEIEGVIAHELSHIKNRDMLISTVAAGIAGAIGYLPYLLLFGGRDNDDRHPVVGLILMLLAPIAAGIIQNALSRQIPLHGAPAVAPLAQVNPLAAHRGGVASLFRTHPPTEARVAALLVLSPVR